MIFAATDWAEASIAIAGIAFITVVASVTIWQVFATGRTGLAVKRENAYRKLAEESAEVHERTAESLGKVAAELGDLRQRTAELERMLKDVG